MYFPYIYFLQYFLLIALSVEKLFWNVVSCKIALKKSLPVKYFVLLLYREDAVKTERHFGYGIWVDKFLRTWFVGCNRGMSEKPNEGGRKLDLQTPWYITRKRKKKEKESLNKDWLTKQLHLKMPQLSWKVVVFDFSILFFFTAFLSVLGTFICQYNH